MTACRHNIEHGKLQEKTHMEYFYKEALRKIREVVNILQLYRLVSCGQGGCLEDLQEEDDHHFQEDDHHFHCRRHTMVDQQYAKVLVARG